MPEHHIVVLRTPLTFPKHLFQLR